MQLKYKNNNYGPEFKCMFRLIQFRRAVRRTKHERVCRLEFRLRNRQGAAGLGVMRWVFQAELTQAAQIDIKSVKNQRILYLHIIRRPGHQEPPVRGEDLRVEQTDELAI